MTQTKTSSELAIMAAALPVIDAISAQEDWCWPGDGGHDEYCPLTDHAASAAAVAATVGLSWEFYGWATTAQWFRAEIKASQPYTKIEIIFDRDHGVRNCGWYARTTDTEGQQEDSLIHESWDDDPNVTETTIRAWAVRYFCRTDGMNDGELDGLRRMVEVRR